MGKIATRIILAFVLVLLLSLSDTFVNYLLSLKVKENSAFLVQSQEVIRNSGSLHKSMIQVQSASRGYLLTHDSSFLYAYQQGLKEIPLLLKEQRTLINNNRPQQKILDSISHLHSWWVRDADQLIALATVAPGSKVNRQVNTSLASTISSQRSKNLHARITTQFSNFDKLEYQQRKKHAARLEASIKTTHGFSLLFFVLTILIGISCTVYIVRLISKRIKSMVHLAEDISRGTFRTMDDPEKDEMTRLSSALNIMSANLSKTIQELEKQNTELDKFSYVVSHDLKAPVRGIHNVIKWMNEDHEPELSADIKRYHRIIADRTQRMEDLINGLLAYARTRESLPKERTDIGQMLLEIGDELLPPETSLLMDSLPVIYTERLKLRQVFMNLINNAVVHAPESKHIVVSYQELANYHHFSVKDDGPGIDELYHSRIFEIFQTLREKNQKESTGIGLAIVKKIIDDQGCYITLESAPGQGTNFIFTWPK